MAVGRFRRRRIGGHKGQRPDSLVVQTEILGIRSGDQELLAVVGDDSYAGRVLFEAVPEALVGEIEEREDAAPGACGGDRLPLLRREIGAGGVVAAAVEQEDIPGGNVLERGNHGVEGDAVAGRLKVRIGLYLQGSGAEDIGMIRPGRVTQPDGGLGGDTTHKVGGDAQRAGPARCLDGGGAPVGENGVVAAEDDLLAQRRVCGEAVNWEIALCLLRAQEPLFGLFYGGQHRSLAAAVFVDADTQVDLIWIGVLLKCCGQAQNGVFRGRVDPFEHYLYLDYRLLACRAAELLDIGFAAVRIPYASTNRSTKLKASTSTRPRSVSFNFGITSRPMKLIAISGSRIVDPNSWAASSRES